MRRAPPSSTAMISSSPDPDWLTAFRHLPVGTSAGTFNGKTWHLTIKASDDGQRHWLYADEAGGNDFVSANLYITSHGRPLLKPCEMPRQTVTAFLLGFTPDA